ncbi:MAG: alpha/beta hydrolase family protein [Acidobacteria bacterium]|nr:alpha/beta hydrolase family protein [Acidobacteriota bacterium]
MAWRFFCGAIDELCIGYKITFRRGRVLATRNERWRRLADPELLADPCRFYALNGTLPDFSPGPVHRLPWTRFQDLAFDSPHPLPFPEANRARARWFRGGIDFDRPLVILGHGWAHRGLENVQRIYVKRIVEGGCDLLLPTLPMHLERAPTGTYSGEIMVSGDVVLTAEAFRQAVVEMRALVRWARQQGYTRVGVLGYSLGGFLAGLLACVERNLSFAIIAGACSGLATTILDTRLGRNIRKDLAVCGMLDRQRLEAAWAILSPARLRPQLPLHRLLLLAGRYDRIMPASSVRQWQRSWQLPYIRWYERGHYTLLALPGKVLKESLAFIHRQADTRAR